MDADGSHAPEQLPRLLAALEHADVVLGSRWVPGGEVVNWPRSREVLSRGGNAWTRLALGLPLADATGGYRAYRREVLDALPLDDVASQGYCFQVDLAWQAWRSGSRSRRGADHLRRARAGHQQDEPSDRARGPVAGHVVGRDQPALARPAVPRAVAALMGPVLALVLGVGAVVELVSSSRSARRSAPCRRCCCSSSSPRSARPCCGARAPAPGARSAPRCSAARRRSARSPTARSCSSPVPCWSRPASSPTCSPLLLLVPPVRAWPRRLLAGWVARRVVAPPGRTRYRPGSRVVDGQVVDGQVCRRAGGPEGRPGRRRGLARATGRRPRRDPA